MSHLPIWSKKGNESDGRDWFFEFTARADRELDRNLVPYDLLTNLAQARALHRVGIISEFDRDQLIDSLRQLWSEWESGVQVVTDVDEDVHSAVERLLTETLGDIGKRIHTGRSRNDQVLCDMRLYLRDQVSGIGELVLKVIDRLRHIAITHPQLYIPGYTHTQPAMPSSVDAWCAGYIDALLGDLESLKLSLDAQRWCPLGTAAGYGVPNIPVDRGFLAEMLGYEGPQMAVTASQLGRGAVELRVVDACAYVALSMNRMAADVVSFANPDLGWVTLSDEQTSGSSIMPQKRNPDAWELIRASGHQFAGLSAQLFSMSSNLTSGYHRDLQNVKAIVMQSVEGIKRVLVAADHALSGMQFDREIAGRRLQAELFATHLANKYVSEGMSFRDAYRKAAESLPELEVLSADDITGSYSHVGSIADKVADGYGSRIDQARKWIEDSLKVWAEMVALLKQ
jgi:argininosuccinate lyase